MFRFSALALIALTYAGTACTEEPKQPAMPPPPPQKSAAPVEAAPVATAAAGAGDPAMVEATQLFAARCAACHGKAGAADGPVAAALTPKPRSFADAEWQKSVTDEHIEKVIREGGPAVGKSPIMPANPDLKDKPAVITALRSIVRSLAKPAQ